MKKQFFTKLAMILIICLQTLLQSNTLYAERPDRFWTSETYTPFESVLAQARGQVPWQSDGWSGYGKHKLTHDGYLGIVSSKVVAGYFPGESNPTITQTEDMFKQSVTITPIGNFEVANYTNSTGEVSWEMQYFDGKTPVQAWPYDGTYWFLCKVANPKLCFNPMRGSMPMKGASVVKPETIEKIVHDSIPVPYPAPYAVHDTTFVPEPYEVPYEVPGYVESMGGGMCCGGGNVSMNNGNVFAPTTIINDDHSVHIDSHDHIIPLAILWNHR